MSEPACSFCGMEEASAGLLVAGPAAYICPCCVELAAEIVADWRRARLEESRRRRERLRRAVDAAGAGLGAAGRWGYKP